jgi:hypothetical protein
VAGSCEYSDEFSGSGAKELITYLVIYLDHILRCTLYYNLASTYNLPFKSQCFQFPCI